MRLIKLLLPIALIALTACTKKPEQPVTIGINPWPGYELLYLSEKKGFFKQADANIKLIQLSSLNDAQRAYASGQTDGMASTMIEAVQVTSMGGLPAEIVMIPDYSDGGDVIIGSKDLTNFSALKGKTIGCEMASLGMFMLHKALQKNGLALTDVNVVNTEQLNGHDLLNQGAIDAFVSYPPFSIEVLSTSEKYHTLFSSADIPGEVIDTVILSKASIRKNPDIVKKLHKAWQIALNYTRQNPDDAYAIMAERERISVAEFKTAFTKDLKILSHSEQQKILSDHDEMKQRIASVCGIMKEVGISSDINCTETQGLVYTGNF